MLELRERGDLLAGHAINDTCVTSRVLYTLYITLYTIELEQCDMMHDHKRKCCV